MKVLFLTREQQIGLCEAFNGEDVKRAFFDIDDKKAAGPDGF